MAITLENIEDLIASDIDEEQKVRKLFEYIENSEFLLKHRCFFLLKELGSKFVIPYIEKMLGKNNILEEDILRILDITTELEVDTPLMFKKLLYSKNPYLVRGEVIALARNGSEKSIDLLLTFASSSKGRIIKRELFSEVFGYMINKNIGFEEYIYNRILENQAIRGYLRDMDLVGPKYNRLSVYPSNDYWALKTRAQGLDYGYFKNIVENTIGKKSHKKL